MAHSVKRRPAGKTAAFSLLVTALAIWTLASSADAITPGGSAGLTLTAPYRGSVHHFESLGHSGCASSKDPTRPFFDLTSGIAGFNSSARASSCTNGTVNSTGTTYAMSLVNVSLIDRPGVSVVIANYSFSLTVNLSSRPGPCTPVSPKTGSSCDVGSNYNLSVSPFVIDTTTGIIYPGGGSQLYQYLYLSNDTYCISGSCSSINSYSGCGSLFCSSGTAGHTIHSMFAGTGSSVFSLPTTMRSGDHYILQVEVLGRTYALIYQDNAVLVGASASAEMNLGSAGNYFALNSIVER